VANHKFHILQKLRDAARAAKLDADSLLSEN
jgi:hypothetical protein